MMKESLSSERNAEMQESDKEKKMRLIAEAFRQALRVEAEASGHLPAEVLPAMIDAREKWVQVALEVSGIDPGEWSEFETKTA